MQNVNFDAAFKSKPKALMCYLCGREYGTKSLEIHIKTCIKKWEVEENKKPKRERRPLPQPPKELGDLLGQYNMDRDEIEAYNSKANDQWTNETLIRCEFCNRTFLEHRIPGHKKICTAERPFKPLAKQINPSSSTTGSGVPSYDNPSSAVPQKRMSGMNENLQGQGNSSAPNYNNNNSPSPKKIANAYENPQKMNEPQARKVSGFGVGAGAGVGAKIGGNQVPRQESRGGAGALDNQPIKKQGGKAMMDEYVDPNDIQLEPCSICGRSFAVDRLAKHTTICRKTYQPPAEHLPPPPPKKPKKQAGDPKWKKQHEELVQSMKYMRDVKNAEMRGDKNLPPPPPSMTQHYDDYVQCPYCGRKYNEEVANRHIPKCKDIINKPKPPPSKINNPSISKLTSGANNNNFGNNSNSNMNYNASSGSKLGGMNSSSSNYGYNASSNNNMNYNMSSNMNYMNNNHNNAATPSKMVTPSKNVVGPSPKLISPGVKGLGSASGVKRKY